MKIPSVVINKEISFILVKTYLFEMVTQAFIWPNIKKLPKYLVFTLA